MDRAPGMVLFNLIFQPHIGSIDEAAVAAPVTFAVSSRTVGHHIFGQTRQTGRAPTMHRIATLGAVMNRPVSNFVMSMGDRHHITDANMTAAPLPVTRTQGRNGLSQREVSASIKE